MYVEEIENLALMQILCINRNKTPGAQITKGLHAGPSVTLKYMWTGFKSLMKIQLLALNLNHKIILFSLLLKTFEGCLAQAE